MCQNSKDQVMNCHCPNPLSKRNENYGFPVFNLTVNLRMFEMLVLRLENMTRLFKYKRIKKKKKTRTHTLDINTFCKFINVNG